MRSVVVSLCSISLALGLNSASGQGQVAFRTAASTGAVQEQRGAGNPSLTLYGGLATGDGSFGVGPALAASFRWNLVQLPFDLRLDPYFAYHSADGDANIWFLGASGNVEFAFRTEGSTTEPYLFGGAGMYLNRFSAGDSDDTGFDPGFGLGGGVRFGGLTLEAKMRDIDEFTTVSFLLGFMLGGR